MRIGSDEHKKLFCESFLASHLTYDPRELSWPVLAETDLARLRAIPFWSTAVAVETNAGNLVSTFAPTLADPLIREAVALQGREEKRHAELLATMLKHYGIAIGSRPQPPVKATRRAFSDFGYEECLDAYFGFGLFGIARQLQYFSEALMVLFEPLLQEETRHIVFFVNWIAYERARNKYAVLTPLLTTYGYVRALGRLLATARGATHDGTGFIATGSEQMISGLTLQGFLASCQVMNERFMHTVDSRLLQPRVIPVIGDFLLRLMPSAQRPQAAQAQ